MNLVSLFQRQPPTSVALLHRGRAVSYGALLDTAARIRGGLRELGLAPGDRVAIACGNNPSFVMSYLAAVGGGFVAVPINPGDPTVAMQAELDRVQARAVIVGSGARESFEGIPRGVLASVECAIGCGFAPEGGYDLDVLALHDPVPIVERSDDDLAVLVFTSGTAGTPRPAMLSHGNLRTNIAQTLALPGGAQQSSDVVFGVLPMFHIFGVNVVLGTTLAVGGCVLMVERFDPASALDAIAKHHVTVVSGAPTMWAAFAAMTGVPSDAFATVRLAVSGAARLQEDTARVLLERFGLRVHEGYGLTEASPVVTSTVGTDAPIGSVGVPVSGLDVRIVTEDGEDALVGDPGEIWVRGGNVFLGYDGDESSTRRVIDQDAWLHTGDVATVDDDGYLYVVDRLRDLIIVSGFNVAPAEVEAVLNSHPSVDLCAVVGVPHPYSGEAVKAYVVPALGVEIDEDELIRFCSARLPRYKCPEKVWFVGEIPVGATGKALRRAVR